MEKYSLFMSIDAPNLLMDNAIINHSKFFKETVKKIN